MRLNRRLYYRSLALLGIDSLLRNFNKDKLLVVTYHGICKTSYDPPFWTQLPEKVFIGQIKYLSSHYTIISLSEFISCLEEGIDLPERAALVTFDDGLRNNYTVAFPILVRFGIQATIFLTTDFMGTEKIFWFDELYLLLKRAFQEKTSIQDLGEIYSGLAFSREFADFYNYTVGQMKRMPDSKRTAVLEALRKRIPVDPNGIPDDFKMLDWGQIKEMDRSGLIDFGIHTANHKILAGLSKGDFNKEIAEPKDRLSERLNRKILSFCYPNGRPGLDYTDEHKNFLSSCGYMCAFTTQSVLNGKKGMDPYQIGRVSVGNDFTSNPDYFRLKTSGYFLKGK
jgi:peptidoglycan/xylan/chitin deacetylase (PgdA/CDA1 family)